MKVDIDNNRDYIINEPDKFVTFMGNGGNKIQMAVEGDCILIWHNGKRYVANGIEIKGEKFEL